VNTAGLAWCRVGANAAALATEFLDERGTSENETGRDRKRESRTWRRE